MDLLAAESQCEADAQALWQEYLAERSDSLRNELVARYMPLVNRIAGFYYSKRVGGHTDFQDYQNLAVIGLIHAIEKYQPRADVKFETFASYRIKGNILNSLRFFSEKNAYLSREQVRNRELVESLTDIDEKPGEDSLFNKILDATLNLTYSALLTGIENQAEEEFMLNPVDGYHHCEIGDLKRVISDILSNLPKKQQLVVRYYYFHELSFVEIASLIGVSKGRISQIHREAVENVRNFYNTVVDIERM